MPYNKKTPTGAVCDSRSRIGVRDANTRIDVRKYSAPLLKAALVKKSYCDGDRYRPAAGDAQRSSDEIPL